MPTRPPRRSEQTTNRRRKPQYDGAWRTHAADSIAAHRALHGDTCPGWQRAPHPIHPNEWTCDHDLGPLCRSCNSVKGATFDKHRRR